MASNKGIGRDSANRASSVVLNKGSKVSNLGNSRAVVNNPASNKVKASSLASSRVASNLASSPVRDNRVAISRVIISPVRNMGPEVVLGILTTAG